MTTKLMKIGFQGEKGAYSESAIKAMFKGREVEKVSYRTSYAVVEADRKSVV